MWKYNYIIPSFSLNHLAYDTIPLKLLSNYIEYVNTS